MFGDFEKRRVAVGDVTINAVIGGRGPPVLLLHGYPQSLAMWAKIAPILARDWTVVAADLRGYGDSGKPQAEGDNANYSFRAMATDQVGLMIALGFESFHLIGHDRGGRVGHRLALDHPKAVKSLAVLDIVPTYAMFMDTNRSVAAAYWHWYFLSQPAPFPEHMIALDPDYFFETCLTTWGKARLQDFDTAQLEEYRRCWRMPEMIHGSCADYRAAAAIDLEHDVADLNVKVSCPALVFWGGLGLMGRLFDMSAEWSKRLQLFETASLPGGHFFPDQFPEETAARLAAFLRAAASETRPV